MIEDQPHGDLDECIGIEKAADARLRSATLRERSAMRFGAMTVMEER